MGYEEEETEVSTGKGLRAQLETALAKLAEYETQFATIKKTERDNTLKSFIESKGLNSKVLDLLPASVESTEAAEEWVNSYAEVFGLAAGNVETQPKPFDLAEAASAQRIQNLSNTGQRPSSLEDLTSRIQASGDDALKVLQQSKDLFL